ncbi:MAG: phosphoenolpyruvate carboxykinase (GTP) [Nitrososphaerales archaeon]|jgi:phosphoenolpyruvate carboxykinase (GTP)|nr:phosphoenolpyruvate carboxykinase (GTP) [Nitrososphaerales archaeon]
MKNLSIEKFVSDVAELTKPDDIIWCDGSEKENETLISKMLKEGIFIELNQEKNPKSYLHRSDPNDVARTEHLTFICSKKEEDTGPTNNWSQPDQFKVKLNGLFDSAMEGRTMYIVPYLMGPEGSPYSQVGVQITDSPYVVANLRIMTRMGKRALDYLGESDNFVKGIHSTGDLSPDRRYIGHFPEERLIMSIGSGYGGNALLSKKCHSLRIASVIAREKNWLAEHMLILGIESPDGELTYISGAFPSASGKTNLALMKPPEGYKDWKAWTLGDDIAWFHIGKDDRLWAINPEAGFFGVAPGTNMKSNPNAIASLKKNAIFTNVAVTADGNPWWEGLTVDPPNNLTDWHGKLWKQDNGKAAHPNSRFTTAIYQTPSVSPKLDDPQGVPVSAMLFGGRRAKLTPLVYESFNWVHGVFIGATMGAETTAAAVGKVGVIRRDPMAMRPFCGYHMADYFSHWIKIGSSMVNPPRIFHVNWFRLDENGKFIWPGFGDNIRVLKWIVDRVKGRGKAIKTPIGYIPTPDALDINGLNISSSELAELLRVDNNAWLEEMKEIRTFFTSLGKKLPNDLLKELTNLETRLKA